MLLFAALGVLNAVAGARAASPPDAGTTSLARYTKVEIAVPAQQGASVPLDVLVPRLGSQEQRLTTPAAVYDSVIAAYAVVVEPQQAGLVDAKHAHLASAPLHPREAWHHFSAARQGVVDSARFLITFSLVPSVQSGGPRLHLAAALGVVGELEALLAADGADPNLRKAGEAHTALHFAVIMGQTRAAAVLLDAGADIEARGADGATPLMAAAALGDPAIVRLLLQRGAAPGAPHAFAHSTPLHFAAEMGRAEAAALLCAAGADARARSSAGGTPLHTAADCNQSGVLRTLVHECGADVHALLAGDTQALYLAAQRGFSAVVAELAAAGADIDFVMPRGAFKGHLVALSSTGDAAAADDGSGDGSDPLEPTGGRMYGDKNTKIGNGATALHAAVENGHPDTVATLLALGAAQLASMEGATPLVIALQYRHPGIAMQLLRAAPQSDPQVDARVPADGSFALLAAVRGGFDAVARELLARGARVDLADRAGATPFAAAVHRGAGGLARELLAAGALSRAGAGAGLDAALRAAVDRRSEEALRMLLEAAAATAVDAAAAAVTAAFHLAASRGWVAGLRLLLPGVTADGRGARGGVDARVPASNASALILAAAAGHVEAVAFLTAAGADVNATAGRALLGTTALLAAAQRGSLEAVELLLAAGAGWNARLRGLHATALYLAAERGHVAVVLCLLQQQQQLAARRRQGEDATAVGQQRLDVRARVKGGATVLHAAVLAGDECASRVLRPLVEAGAAVGATDDAGRTALHICVAGSACAERTVQLLLALGASPQASDLRALVESGRADAARASLAASLLRDAGVDVDAASLSAAAARGDDNPQTLHALLRRAMISDDVLAAALGAAVQAGSVGAARALLSRGADPRVPCGSTDGANGDRAALDIARDMRNFELIKLLSLASG